MIDLHVHTVHSDGKLQVNEILERAKEENIKILSFCDHNVLGAYEELESKNISDYNVKIITGIEFDFVYEHKDFHMLGYNFNWKEMNKSKFIDKKTDEEKISEEQKNLDFLKDVCKKVGIKINDNLKIKSPNEKASTVLKYHMIEFEENNKILDEMLGKNRDKSFARGFVGNPNTPFYIDMTANLPKAEEVAELIHNCGGEVYLAHPFDYKNIDCKKYIEGIYNLGILDGIECIHTRHTLEQIEYIRLFCKENKLKISGGSDFHRDVKQKLGYGVNGTEPITEFYYFNQL